MKTLYFLALLLGLNYAVQAQNIDPKLRLGRMPYEKLDSFAKSYLEAKDYPSAVPFLREAVARSEQAGEPEIYLRYAEQLVQVYEQAKMPEEAQALKTAMQTPPQPKAKTAPVPLAEDKPAETKTGEKPEAGLGWPFWLVIAAGGVAAIFFLARGRKKG